MVATNALIAAIIGLFVGGFLNAFADDLPARGRLRLPHYADGTPRPPVAWLGLTAFLTGQRTSPSGSRLGWRYPITELATALSFAVTVLATADDPAMTPLQLFFWLVYIAFFVLIVIIDVEHRLILFNVIIPAGVVALIDALLTPATHYGPTLANALIGGGVGFAISFVLYLGGFLFIHISGSLRGHSVDEVAFGYGDVMLFTFSGLILGPQSLLFAIYITVIAGALGAFIYLLSRFLSRTRYSLFTPLPYGPYIVFGTVIMLLFAHEVMLMAGFGG